MGKLKTWRGLLKHVPTESLNNLSEFSQAWTSCAVGEKLGFPCNSRHELEELISDYDSELDRLGIEFYEAIESNDKSEAMKVLRNIEEYEISDDLRVRIGDPLNPFR